MKQVHHIWLTIYCKPEDNEKEVLDNFLKFLPFDLEKEKLKIEDDKAEIIEDRKINIFKICLDKSKHINQFIKNLNSILNDEQKELLINQKESRLDSENHFFIRFDKDKLINKGLFFITDKGNCYHIRMAIAAFPTTRENSLKVVEEMFS